MQRDISDKNTLGDTLNPINVARQSTAIDRADAEIIFTKAPYIQYEQILLDKNFRQHLETIMVSKKI